MIYLILDTNIWLYLANGFNPITEKPHENLHFQLLTKLKELNESNNVCILVNEVIFEEWKRNKENNKLRIKKLTNKLENSNSLFTSIKKYVKSNTDSLQKEFVEGLKEDIVSNEEHIQRVETFLFNDCQKVTISQELKIQIFDLALSNKAPFHNKKNNIADASILFSAADFLKGKLGREDKSAIFVSNNFKDFTDSKNKNDFHPDIKKLLDDTDINYRRALPDALELREEIISQIEEYHKYEMWLDSILFHCRTSYCDGNKTFSPWGYLDNRIKVKYKTEQQADPNQINLFTELQAVKKESKTVGIGDCLICGTLHVECPICAELNYVDDQTKRFACSECSANLEMKYDDTEEEMYLFINDMEEDEHE